MQLSDFFATLNFYNLSIFFLVFLILDAIGFRIALVIKPPQYLRITFWIWGLSVLVFVWFFLHFFLPFWTQYIWFSLIILGIFSISPYLKNNGLPSFIDAIFKYPYPLILLIIAAKPLYFLLSAPPYYGDEMIYQFYSPARIFWENSWNFLGNINSVSAPNLYEMIPKFLNVGYWLIFSLTKTYATARLLHFLIVFSCFYAISIFLRKSVSLFVSLSYLFLTLYLSASFLHFSTLGYVDAGAAAFAALFLITVVDLLMIKKKNSLYASAVVLGITIGMKYTILAFLFSVILIGLIVAAFSYKKLIHTDIKKIFVGVFRKRQQFVFFNTLLLAAIFGGYWYIKNFLMSGNPIYPFFFRCLHSWKCATGFGFFSGWAIPLDWQHFPLIKDIIFQSSNVFFYSVILSLILAIVGSRIFKIKLIQIISLLITLSVITEILLSNKTSGFELRYYYHWVLLIPLVLVLPFAILIKFKTSLIYLKSTLFIVFLFILFSTAGPVAYRNIKRLYEGDFVYGYVRNYATGRIGLNQWIDYYYPQMNDFIKWCGKKGPHKDVLVIDPGLIWISSEEYMRVFMVNCSLITNVIDDYTNPEIISSIKNNHPNAYIVSLERCEKNKSYKGSNPDPYIVSRYKANKEVICKSEEIFKNLYRLSY